MSHSDLNDLISEATDTTNRLVAIHSLLQHVYYSQNGEDEQYYKNLDTMLELFTSNFECQVENLNRTLSRIKQMINYHHCSCSLNIADVDTLSVIQQEAEIPFYS